MSVLATVFKASPRRALEDRDGTVVVAMVVMRVVQMPVDQIIHVVAMRHRLVAASGPMLVTFCMPGALMSGGAGGRVVGRHLKSMFVDMIVVHMMQMAIVQVIDVVAVTDGGVAAIGPVAV